MAQGTGRKNKVSDKDLIKALEDSSGIITTAAKRLGVSRRLIHRRFSLKPEKWLKIREDIENRNLDFAEEKLKTLIENLEPSAIYFYLKCKGKKRGYVEKQEINIFNSLDARTRPKITSDMTEVEAAQAYIEMIKKDKK